MNLKTKYFGYIDYDEENVVHFRQGLFGFETEREFLLLPFEGSGGTLLSMQSTQTPELAFVIMNPFSLKPDYTPLLQAEELAAMGASDSRELCYYVLSVVHEPVSESTVNLKCPVVINEDTREAMQVILNTDDYGMRHRLAEFGQGGNGSPC